MNNRKENIERVYAIIVEYDDVQKFLAERPRTLEPTRDDVWLSKTCCCARFGLRGVPTNRVDVLVDRRLCSNEPLHPKGCIEFSLVNKIGRYDGAKRERLAFRMLPRSAGMDHTHGAVRAVDMSDSWRIEMGDCNSPMLWVKNYKRLRTTLDEYNPQRLLIWHWTRYYRHLPYETAEQVAQTWILSDWANYAHEWTLAEANRSASRALYRASREAGFRKMTLRERLKCGLTAASSQWQRADSVKYEGTPTGCGQATLEAAAGKAVEWSDAEDGQL